MKKWNIWALLVARPITTDIVERINKLPPKHKNRNNMWPSNPLEICIPRQQNQDVEKTLASPCYRSTFYNS